MSEGFKIVTRDILVETIRSAGRRLVVVAPAVTTPVAAAICERWHALSPDAVTVIVDADPDVYRLGFGDPAALSHLEQTAKARGTVLRNQPGLRVGIVIADNRTLIYAPTAELMEGSRAFANGICLDTPPTALKTGVGLDGAGEPQVGRSSVTPDQIHGLHQDLAANPPQKFDTARKVRVFNAFFEFVDVHVRGTRLSRHTVRIPTHLLAVADAETRERLQATFRLVPPQDELSGEAIEHRRKLLEHQFLREIPAFGTVVLRRDKEKLVMGLTELQKAVTEFGQQVRATITDALDRNREHLLTTFLPALTADPPDAWRPAPGERPSADAVRRLLDRDLRRCFGTADRLLREMTVRWQFKGVTYEMLSDPKFMDAAMKAFPELERFHEEFDALEPASQTEISA